MKKGHAPVWFAVLLVVGIPLAVACPFLRPCGASSPQLSSTGLAGPTTAST